MRKKCLPSSNKSLCSIIWARNRSPTYPDDVNSSHENFFIRFYVKLYFIDFLWRFNFTVTLQYSKPAITVPCNKWLFTCSSSLTVFTAPMCPLYVKIGLLIFLFQTLTFRSKEAEAKLPLLEEWISLIASLCPVLVDKSS